MNKIDYSHSFTGEDNNKRNYLNQKELINIKHYMKTLKQDLGKVSVTCNGVWDAGRNYDRLCIVNDGNFASYISKKFAPEGILLSNEEYWQPIASLRDDIKIDYDKFKKEWIQMLAEIQLKLKASRIVVENDIERESLSWLQVAAGCEVYVKDTKLSWILESIVPVLNYKEWRLESDSKIDSVPTYELTGEFENLIADRTIADRWGHIIDEYYVTRDMVTNFIIETVRKYIHEVDILPGSIKPEDLSQAVLDLIGYGQITNLADEEDLTDYTNANGTHVLRFKDKVYNEADGSGLGRVYLRKNKVQGVNTLVQQMIDKPNTIYIVQYDYTLGEQTINLPENSILKFEGGTLCNGIIVGNNTQIDAEKEVIFKIGLNIEGTWNCPNIYDDWFEFNSVLGDKFISNDIINNILALSSDYVNNTIHFEADRTYYFELLYKGRANLGDDVRPNYWKLNTEEYAFLRIFTGVTSNTHLIFNNTLQMIPTNQGAYFIFHIESKENIQISGTGTINADALNHKYTDPFAGTLYYGEWGHIFNFRSCNNIVIKDVTLAYAFGDAIGLGNVGLNIDGNKGCLAATKNVTIDGIKVLYARRNGISLGGNNYSISNVYFEGCGSEAIRGTAPKAAIDFENDYTEIDPSGICTNVVMSNCKFKDNAYDVSSTIRWDLGEVPTGQLVTINGCNFTAPLRLNKTRGLTFNDCHIVGISSHDNSISPWTVSEEWIFNNCNFDELNPYLVVSANDYKHQFNNCTYPEDIQCHKIFRGSLAGTRAIKFSIPKPIPVGELEFVAICTNSSYSIAHLPINTTKYTIGNNTNLVDIRDIRIEARVDSYPRFSMYQQTPVFSYIDYNEDADNINIYFSLGGNITGSPLAGNTEVNIFMNSKTKYIVKEEPVSEGSTAGIYGGKWSEVSAITKTLINISDIPSTVVFPSREMYPNSTMSDLNQITNLKSQRMGTQIYVTDTSYRQPAYWDSTGLTWRTADGNRTLERNVTTTEALDTLTAKLTESDRGYRVYTSVHSSYLTWDGIQWLNEDGSLYSDVKFINKFFTIERLNNAMSNSNVTYKIVGNIDLDGGELTIASGSTLDFQGGSFSNGTIIGNDTKIINNLSYIFKNVEIQGVWNVSEVYPEWFGAKGDGVTDDTISLQMALDFPVKSYRTVCLLDRVYLIGTRYGDLNVMLFINSNTTILSNTFGTIKVADHLVDSGVEGEHYYTIIGPKNEDISYIENVTIKNLIFDHNGSNNLLSIWTSRNNAIRILKGNNIEIINCEFKDNTGLQYIVLGDNTDVGIGECKILNCDFSNSGASILGNTENKDHSSIYYNGTGILISNCNFINRPFSELPKSPGNCAIELHGGYNNVSSCKIINYTNSIIIAPTTGCKSPIAKIDNCIISGHFGVNIWSYGDYDLEEVDLTNSYIELIGGWGQVITTNKSISPFKRLVLDGCTIARRGPNQSNTYCMGVDAAENVIISNNNFVDCITGAFRNTNRADFPNFKVFINNNKFSGTVTESFIYISNVANQNVCDYFELKDNYFEGSAVSGDIYIPTVNGGLIENNTFNTISEKNINNSSTSKILVFGKFNNIDFFKDNRSKVINNNRSYIGFSNKIVVEEPITLLGKYENSIVLNEANNYEFTTEMINIPLAINIDTMNIHAHSSTDSNFIIYPKLNNTTSFSIKISQYNKNEYSGNIVIRYSITGYKVYT